MEEDVLEAAYLHLPAPGLGGGATTYHPLRTAILLVVDLMLVPWRVHSKIRLAGPLHAAHLPALVTVLA